MISLNDFILISRRHGKPNDKLFVNIPIDDFGTLLPCKINKSTIEIVAEESSLSLIDQLMNSRVSESLSEELNFLFEEKLYKIRSIDFFENKAILNSYL